MNARTRILERLKKEGRPMKLPERWEPRPIFSDLAIQFEAALTAVKGEVLWADDWDQALGQLQSIVRGIGAEKIVANHEEPLNRIDTAGVFPGVVWQTPELEPAEWRAACTNADMGVTGADLAMADTGTVVASTGPGKSRLVSLLPPVHVALIPKSRLVADLFSVEWPRVDELPSQVVLISGPSKTADIEQTLVVGVHGPKRMVAILYDDFANLKDTRGNP